MSEALALLPARIPVDLMTALGGLIAAALDGAMLGVSDQAGVLGEIRIPDEMDRHAAADRLRHATAAVRGVPYELAPREPEADDLTVGKMRVDDDGLVSIGIGGAEDTVEDAVKWLLGIFLPALDEQSATNYLEWNLSVPALVDGLRVGPRQEFSVIVCRPGGKTPHQLRREAEAEVERLRALGSDNTAEATR